MAVGGLADWMLSVTIPVEPVPINVRWKPDLSTTQRSALEQRFHLSSPEFKEGTTWQYELFDYSRGNIQAVVQDGSVLDTAHVDRAQFVPEVVPEREGRIRRDALLIGAIGSIVVLLLRAAHTARIVVSSRSLTAVVAAAPLVFLFATALVLVLAALGYQPLWQAGPPITLAQAAYATDRATVYRMIKEGANPNEASRVTDDTVLTPLEAAVLSRDLEVVQILVGLGATVDDSNRRRLTCFALEEDDQSMVTYLQGSAAAVSPDCAGVHAPVQ